MTTLPKKYLFIWLSDNLEVKLSVFSFIAIILSASLLTIIANIFAFFTVPLYLGIIFAALSEKIEYRSELIRDDEEE